MLQQTSIALQLPIYKMYTVREGINQFRGCIKMAILPKDIFGYPEKKNSMATSHSEYSAIENSAEEAPLFLANHRNFAIKDLNHSAMLHAIKDKNMSESYQGLYKDALEAANEHGQKLKHKYDHLTETISAICAQYNRFLVLPAEKLLDPSLSGSARDDFLFAITQLLHQGERQRTYYAERAR